jgi:hypothetical protein
MIQTDEKDFARDVSSRALINTNIKALHEYRMKKQQVNRIDNIEQDLESLKYMMLEIKQMITELSTGK